MLHSGEVVQLSRQSCVEPICRTLPARNVSKVRSWNSLQINLVLWHLKKLTLWINSLKERLLTRERVIASLIQGLKSKDWWIIKLSSLKNCYHFISVLSMVSCQWIHLVSRTTGDLILLAWWDRKSVDFHIIYCLLMKMCFKFSQYFLSCHILVQLSLT